MSNITIFEEQSDVSTVRRESRRMDRMSNGSGGSMRRIQLSNGRIFKRVVNGEQIGKSVSNQLDVIVVDWLMEPSRKFYAAAYDKDAKATLPDCWSNDGITPEATAKGKRAPCAPMRAAQPRVLALSQPWASTVASSLHASTLVGYI